MLRQQIFRGHRSVWLTLTVNAELDTCNLACVYALFRLISIARYVFKSLSICFQGTKLEIS